MKDLKGSDLDVDVVGVLSSQEEIGERGAFVTRDVVKPDIAICFEGCPADDTFTPDYFIQTAMKKGPMLRHFDRSMVTNPRFQRFRLSWDTSLAFRFRNLSVPAADQRRPYPHLQRRCTRSSSSVFRFVTSTPTTALLR